jgi:hypothetical protein
MRRTVTKLSLAMILLAGSLALPSTAHSSMACCTTCFPAFNTCVAPCGPGASLCRTACLKKLSLCQSLCCN